MPKFQYTLPSGSKFTVIAPKDATQEQADHVFYTQVASGILSTYKTGQTLGSLDVSVDNPTNMSRMERGTAGVSDLSPQKVNLKSDIVQNAIVNLVDNNNKNTYFKTKAHANTNAVTALINGIENQQNIPDNIKKQLINNLNSYVASGTILNALPNTDINNTGGNIISNNGASIPIDQIVNSIIQKIPSVTSIPNLTNIPMVNPVDAADVMLIRGSSLGARPVGPLDAFQVQGLLAQIANFVKQPHTDISYEKGVGKYGFTCYQLEKAGYVKPMTQARYIDPDPSQFLSVMNSPTIWIGKNSITSLDDLLADDNRQNQIQNDLLQAGYDGLQAIGLVTKPKNIPPPQTTTWMYSDQGLRTVGLKSNRNINYDTVRSGVTLSNTSNIIPSTQYYYNVLSSSMVSQNNSALGVLVANSGKYGPELTSVWADRSSTSGLTNMMSNTTNKVYNTNNIITSPSAKMSPSISNAETYSNPNTYTSPSISNTYNYSSSLNNASTITDSNYISSINNSSISSNGLFNASTSSSLYDTSTYINIPNDFNFQSSLGSFSNSMDLLGKSSQFSMGFTDMGNSFDQLSNLYSLGDLSSSIFSNFSLGSLGNIEGMASGVLNQLGDLSNFSLSDMTCMLNGDLGGLFGGDLSSISNMFSGDLSGVLGGDLSSIMNGDFSSVLGGDLSSIMNGDFSSILSGDLSGMLGGDLSGLLGGDLSGMLGGDLSGMLGGNLSGLFSGDLSGMLGGNLSGLLSGDLSGMMGSLSGMLGNLGGMFSGMLGGMLSGMLGGMLGNLFGGDALVADIKMGTGTNGTVERNMVDMAVMQVLGDNKIQVPAFGADSGFLNGILNDISAAKSALSNISQTASSAMNTVSGLFG